jgi:hypothetical protein
VRAFTSYNEIARETGSFALLVVPETHIVEADGEWKPNGARGI